MTIAVAVTDLDWFYFLREEMTPPVINFWTPSGWDVRRLEPGECLYFMLKAPVRRVGGYGVYAGFELMGTQEAWNAFGRGNGVASRQGLVEKMNWYADKRSAPIQEDPVIGCIKLTGAVFWDDDDFLDLGQYGLEFAPNIVTYKYFDVDAIPVHQVPLALEGMDDFSLAGPRTPTYQAQQRKVRVQQSIFRERVLQAYDYQCCVTGESCLEVIQAAHIEPYVDETSNHIQNGLPLRIDLHRLFDAGLWTVTEDHRVQVSPHLESASYRRLEGTPIRLPRQVDYRPSQAALDYHRQEVFRS